MINIKTLHQITNMKNATSETALDILHKYAALENQIPWYKIIRYKIINQSFTISFTANAEKPLLMKWISGTQLKC